MPDDNTRDIAVEAKTKVDAHVTDCQQFRVIIDKRLAEFQEELRKLNWRVAMIVGALTLLGKALDFLHH